MLELDIAGFIRDNWQKKPCLLRNVIADFVSPISPEELAGLACEEDVHCRLVTETGAQPPWTLRYGPFAEQDFLDLPDSNYSLLVSECEKWLPELGELMDLFRFIPDWRVDDLMISYAATGGSVGPHVDQYDVFLLQAMGTRRWLYAESVSTNAELVAGLDLAILQDFEADQEVVLNPGDMLYLPPGFAHHGIALEPCMTYSIGFRAPTAANALESFVLESERLDLPQYRYRDPDLALDRHHAEITDAEIDRLRQLACAVLDESPALWRDAVGKMLSDSAVTTPDDADPRQPGLSDLQACDWIRHPETRLFYHRSEQTLEVYYNGRMHRLPNHPGNLEQLQKLCENRHWSAALMRESLRIEAFQELLIELASEQAILPFSD